jgi:hypothetical protein
VEGFGGRFRWKVSVEGFGGRFRWKVWASITKPSKPPQRSARASEKHRCDTLSTKMSQQNLERTALEVFQDEAGTVQKRLRQDDDETDGGNDNGSNDGDIDGEVQLVGVTPAAPKKARKTKKQPPATAEEIETEAVGILEFAKTLSQPKQQEIFASFKRLFVRVCNEYKPDGTVEVQLIDTFKQAKDHPVQEVAAYLKASMGQLIGSVATSPKKNVDYKITVMADCYSVSARVLPAMALKMAFKVAEQNMCQDLPRLRFWSAPPPPDATVDE